MSTAAFKAAAIPWDGTWRGNPWSEGTVRSGWYNHQLPPNRVCWRPDDWWLLVTPASSYHHGGAHLAMCDGSVRHVTDLIDPTIWLTVGTRAGGEVVW